MKAAKYASFILILLIVIVSIFVVRYEINTKIEESIIKNYNQEIQALKSKIDKHSELINSIISVNGKQDKVESNNVNENEDETVDSTSVEFEYMIENGGVTITKYTGKQTSVVIPNKIQQLPVLKVGKNAFTDTKVKSVTLPSTCTEVDWFAFYGCFALTTVYLSDAVTSIGYGAFDGCSRSLTIYCPKNSYPERFAQSFGISYSNFQ